MADSHETPSDLKYTKEHEWLRNIGDQFEVGITAFAADQLGDVVFVELPEVGTLIAAGQPFGVVESVKSVSDLYAPLSGTVTQINTELLDAPELINDSPYAKGWIIRIKPDNEQEAENLLSAEAYQKILQS
ncbi:MAG: glycine cleavage system protein GcvH [Magnetococcales bacterium]|nr:glycine cleavage system protein GcvH [Magnetococcales bacterium]